MVKNALSRHYDPDALQTAPQRLDYARTVTFDSDGVQHVTYVPVDYPSIVASHGTCLDWSLDAMIKAGISPDIAIRTGNPSRIEGVSQIEEFGKVADTILNENKSE